MFGGSGGGRKGKSSDALPLPDCVCTIRPACASMLGDDSGTHAGGLLRLFLVSLYTKFALLKTSRYMGVFLLFLYSPHLPPAYPIPIGIADACAEFGRKEARAVSLMETVPRNTCCRRLWVLHLWLGCATSIWKASTSMVRCCGTPVTRRGLDVGVSSKSFFFVLSFFPPLFPPLIFFFYHRTFD